MEWRDSAPALIFLGVPGLVYWGLLGGLAWLLGRWWGRSPARAFWLAAGLGTALLVTGVALFDAGAVAARRDPATGGERGGADRLAYVQGAKQTFFAGAAAVPLATAVLGAVLGRRGGRPRVSVGLAAAGAVLLFALLTFGLTDFLNACLVGEPFVLRPSC